MKLVFGECFMYSTLFMAHKLSRVWSLKVKVYFGFALGGQPFDLISTVSYGALYVLHQIPKDPPTYSTRKHFCGKVLDGQGWDENSCGISEAYTGLKIGSA